MGIRAETVWGESKVLCERCEKMLAEWSLQCEPQSQGSEVATVLCARCGGLLSSVDPEWVLLKKLSQLSRFGLGGNDRPLLKDVDDQE